MTPRKPRDPSAPAKAAVQKSEEIADEMLNPVIPVDKPRFALVTDAPARSYTVGKRKYDDHVEFAFVHAGEPGAVEIHEPNAGTLVTTIKRSYGARREILPNGDGTSSEWKIRAWSVMDRTDPEAPYRRYFLKAVPESDMDTPAGDE